MLVKFQAVVSELLKSHPMGDVGVPYIYNIHRIQIKTKNYGIIAQNIEFGNIEEKQL